MGKTKTIAEYLRPENKPTPEEMVKEDVHFDVMTELFGHSGWNKCVGIRVSESEILEDSIDLRPYNTKGLALNKIVISKKDVPKLVSALLSVAIELDKQDY